MRSKAVLEGNLTALDYSVSTLGHEIDHANVWNYNIIKAIDEETWDKNFDSETQPTRTGKKILQELRDKNLKNSQDE